MSQKVWFVTGSSRGFGRVWTKAALERGDRVAATARNPRDLDDLVEAYGDAILPVTLDVTDRNAVFTALNTAHAHFGRIDIVVNNAGYGQFGAIEELSEAEARAQIETNLFGAMWVLQAAVPILREQGGGRILSVSSIGGIVAFPNIGMYHASKWALEAVNDSLAQETAEFGIKVTLIEPGGFATDWGGSSAKHAKPLAAYDALRSRMQEERKDMKRGEPEATAAAILKVVDAENPPLRLFLGATPFDTAFGVYAERLKEWAAWKDVSAKAQGG